MMLRRLLLLLAVLSCAPVPYAHAQQPADTQLWTLWDEVFVTLDDTPGGPAAGFDRNRAFAGILRRWSPRASLEVGYLLQHVHTPTVGSRPRAHAVLTWLNLVF
jgi:hypothetical protein